MPIHKFGRKPINSNPQLLTIQWRPHNDIQYKPKKLSLHTWEIFCQELLTIKPNEIKTVYLSFGVQMSEGIAFISLKHQLKLKRCSIQNETVFESVDNILISIQNNSTQDVVISPGQGLCYIHYL